MVPMKYTKSSKNSGQNSLLRKEIIFAIILKCIALFMLWYLCFSYLPHTHTDKTDLQHRLLGP